MTRAYHLSGYTMPALTQARKHRLSERELKYCELRAVDTPISHAARDAAKYIGKPDMRMDSAAMWGSKRESMPDVIALITKLKSERVQYMSFHAQSKYDLMIAMADGKFPTKKTRGGSKKNAETGEFEHWEDVYDQGAMCKQIASIGGISEIAKTATTIDANVNIFSEREIARQNELSEYVAIIENAEKEAERAMQSLSLPGCDEPDYQPV